MNKRLFDIVLGSILLLLTLPLILIGALLVKLTSAGPAFFRAKRAGRGGEPFDMFKLRTMHVHPGNPGRKITAAQDDRVTTVGKLLRKSKIDELPQLWNVVRGEMSIVGPRPEDWEIVEQHYTPQQRRTLEVRPGIVSPAEVRWYPDLTYHDPPPTGIPIQDYYLSHHMPAQLAEALRYVDRHNLWLDFTVIVEVVGCLLVYSWLPPRRCPPSYLKEHRI